jgi:ribosomal protein S11
MAVFLLLSLLIGSVAIVPSNSAAKQETCAATPVATGATPVATDGQFKYSDCATTVIFSAVNNGSVPPEYQEGTEITIDSAGHAAIETKTEGTPVPAEQAVEIGVDGLQQLLVQLQDIGYFDLPQPNPVDETPQPVGGPNNVLSVTLADGTWSPRADLLDDAQLSVLNQAQQAIANAVSGTSATPAATAAATPCVIVPAAATPVATGDQFPLPDCGTVVIQSIVNNGPVSPESQQGYQITIDTGGTAIVATKSQGTPTPTTQIVVLGPDGLQLLLQQLEQIGYFDLVTKAQGTPLVGGPTNTLSVWLNGQSWQVNGAVLSGDDLATLNEAQQAIATAVGVPLS